MGRWDIFCTVVDNYGDIAAAWPDFVANRKALQQQGKAWASALDQTGDIPETSEVCEVTFFEGRPISVVLPKIIVREVEYTEPAARGDTSGKITKAAVLKGTKHELQVSAFIEIGDKIEIDTETGEFRRRCT